MDFNQYKAQDMSRIILNIILLVLFLYLCFVGAGCAPTGKAIHLDPTFDSSLIDNIVILPALDIRKDLSIALREDWEKRIVKGSGYWTIERYFKRKGYNNMSFSYEENYGGIDKIADYDLQDPDSDFIKKIGPEDCRWVLLFVLEDMATRKSFGRAHMCECAGYLFDKNASKVVWHHQAIFEWGSGGLIGLLTKPKPKYFEALVESCFFGHLLWQTFPNRE